MALHYNKNVGRMNSDHLHVSDVNIFLSHKERGITMNEYRKECHFWMTDKRQCLLHDWWTAVLNHHCCWYLWTFLTNLLSTGSVISEKGPIIYLNGYEWTSDHCLRPNQQFFLPISWRKQVTFFMRWWWWWWCLLGTRPKCRVGFL